MDVYEAVRALGAARVEASFSGGNDEGGYDGVSFFGADGARLELGDFNPWREVSHKGRDEWDQTAGRYVKVPPKPETERTLVADTLEKVLDDRYGSFAGEFYVRGTVTIDAAARKTVLQGETETPSSEDFEESWS
jgi:hypothetical protein